MVTHTLNLCSAFNLSQSAHTHQWTHTHLTYPKCTHTPVNTHTPWTHTRSSGQPFMLWHPGSSWGFGVLLKGLTSVVVLRVERALYIHSPHLQSLPDRDSNICNLWITSPTLLTIRPRLPQRKTCYVIITMLVQENGIRIPLCYLLAQILFFIKLFK